MTKNSIEIFDNATFKKEVLDTQKPTIVDFWADWCGPCRMLSPILDEIAEEYKNNINLVKINVDQNQVIAAEYGITSIPSIFLFSKGRIVKRLVGALPKKTLIAEFKEYLQ